MSKEMIVSVNGREKKIAIVDNGKVTEFYIERGEENSGVAGNVYKGRVMRVLPGMQSAFVDIGLERDAFLYVTDFFDEEEEIERIVLEKGKKTSPEDAKREAQDQIDLKRAEREKQMDAAQDITEPMADEHGPRDAEQSLGREDREERPREEQTLEEPSEDRSEKPKRGRGGRGRKTQDDREPKQDERELSSAVEAPVFELDASGFERISDDADGGDSSRKAVQQEAKLDRVRAAEFDIETTAEAEVGSLMPDVTAGSSGFERIADEDDETAAPAKKGRGRTKAEPKTKPAAKKPSSRAKKKVTAEDAPLEDAEASVSEPGDVAEMAVRRGGRGRRRGGKPKAKGANGEPIHDEDGNVIEEHETPGDADHDDGDDQVTEAQPEADDQPIEDSEPEAQAADVDAAGIEEAPPADDNALPAEDRNDRPDRSRGRRGGRGGRDRNDRPSDRPAENDERSDRPSRDASDRPSRETSDRPARETSDRPERNDRSRGGRNDRNDRGRDRPPQPTISDLLKEGQEILVQIAKEPIAKKGARITSHIAMPGRFLVYMPTIEHLGVSRKIESSNERSRLRTMLQKIRQDKDIPQGGFIVRTAGIGISEEDLRNDARFLAKTWAEAKKGSEKKRSPALVHQDLDLVQRLLRDQLSDDFTAIRVDSEEEYLRTVEFMNLMAPKMVNRVKLYTRDEPILDYYGVQEEIDKALKPRVWLKSGGYLVINQTEALVAIDVNTGKFVGKGNARLEDTITRTNMEAVDEIARQIRLRDLGGILVLDLIDMEDRRNRHKVSQALQEALSHDKSPTKVLSFNDFGLIIMTRKRVKQSLERTMCTPCDNCEGAGWVKSPTTVCYEILAEARRMSKHLDDVRHTTLRVHPEVAGALRNSERAVMDEIEAYLGNVDVSSDKSVHQGQFDFAFI
ncbi:MAG TPA: Rne/Rng family ribonuclease [Pyrinomonadaceae bacterium]|jgi:ribonuclease G|nr:Rne/Rng family ribonuclease [Pyrinomonadaceae bacterium]